MTASMNLIIVPHCLSPLLKAIAHSELMEETYDETDTLL